jgi:hypothetical protein
MQFCKILRIRNYRAQYTTRNEFYHLYYFTENVNTYNE